MSTREQTRLKIVLVTGPSGAGRSTAIHVLEDLGYEAIDNLPFSFLSGLVESAPGDRPVALGMDSRNRDFSPAALLEAINMVERRQDVELSVLYMDARADVLLRRFSETRRRHPLSPAESPEIGVRRDLQLMADIRARADILLDTSNMNVHQAREEIESIFAPQGRVLAVSIQSFSYKRGVPYASDLVFDCRFLNNPYWVADLRGLDGRDRAVQDHVKGDPRFQGFYDRVLDLVHFLLPAYREEGKSHLSIAFGCTGGQHRSVTLAETLAKALAEEAPQVSIRHRELHG